MHSIVKTNSIVKLISYPGTEVYQYLRSCGIVQVVPSVNEDGDLLFIFTEMGLISITVEDQRIFCCHKLITGDYWEREYTLLGYLVANKIQGYHIPAWLV
jgi:hypothetical protein